MWQWTKTIDGIDVGFTNIFLNMRLRRSQFALSRQSVHELKSRNMSAEQIIEWLYKSAHEAEVLNTRFMKNEMPSYREQLSVAQNGKSGFVYFMYAGEHKIMKIGCSTNPEKRVKQIRKEYGYDIQIIAKVRTTMMYELEREFHNLFISRHKHGEWFNIGPEQIKIVERHLNKKAKKRAA